MAKYIITFNQTVVINTTGYTAKTVNSNAPPTEVLLVEVMVIVGNWERRVVRRLFGRSEGDLEYTVLIE